MAAIPVTVIYKIMYGAGNAPFSSSDASSITFAWPESPFATLDERGDAPEVDFGVSPGQALALGTTAGILITLVQSTSFVLIDSQQLDDVEGVEADELAQWASRALCVTGVYLQVVGALGINWSGTKPSDQANGAAWAVALFPLCANLTFTFFGSKKAVTEFVDTYGNDLATCMQAVLMGFGVWQATEQGLDEADYTGWDVALSVIGPLPGLFACLMSEPNEDTVLACGAYDLLTSIGAGIVTAGAAAADN